MTLLSLTAVILSFMVESAVAALPVMATEHDHVTDHAVILTYHHVSAATPSSTSLTPQEFAAHLNLIADSGYVVWPLAQLLERLRAGQGVPQNAVALTFDDAYQSVFTEARPLLEARGWPYTIFVTTDAIDHRQSPYMTWEQLRTLVAEGVGIGNHSTHHTHLARQTVGESQTAWRQRVREDIEHAAGRLKIELGVSASLFAYPYGEYSQALRAEIADMDLIGLGQHSGPIGFDSDFLALPRFPVAGNYAGLDDLALRLKTQPLNIQAEPVGPQLLASTEEITLRVPPGPYDSAQIACYASGQGRMHLELMDSGRYKIRPMRPLLAGRSKYNCTIPHDSESGVYFWWSYLLMKPHADGSWYDN